MTLFTSRHALIPLASIVLHFPTLVFAETSDGNANETGSGEVFQLDPILVTATGFEQLLSDAPASVTVIDRSEIESRPGDSIVDLIGDSVGVSIQQEGKLLGGDITIRGLSEDYVALLVDGKPLGASQSAYYNGWGAGQLTTFLPPNAMIERVEVIRGPMSSLYGTSAMGGVVNVITKKTSDVWTGEVTLGYTLQENSQSSDDKTLQYYLTGPLIAGRLNLSLFGDTSERAEDRYVGGFPEGKLNTHGARLNWIMSDRQDLAFEIGRSDLDYELTSVTSSRTNSYVDTERTYGALTHTFKWDNGAETVSYLSHERVDIDNGALDPAVAALQPAYLSSYDVTILNSKTTVGWQDHKTTFGFDYRYEATSHERARFIGSINTDLTRWQFGVFAEDDWEITPDLTLTAGLRFDENENYGSTVTPRLYAVYRLNDAVTLRGGYSAGFLTPELKQADGNIVEQSGRGAAWDIGNTNLQPEGTDTFEVGVAYQSAAGWQASVTAFHTKFDNKIDQEVICETPVGTPASCSFNGQTRDFIRQYVNVDKAELQGIEATLDIPLGNFDVRANYTYSDSEYLTGENAGNSFNEVPDHLFNLRLGWAPNERTNVWSSLTYRSEATSELLDSAVSPARTLVDLGVSYQVTDAARLNATVYNVFDREVLQSVDGTTLDGRRLFVGLTTSF
ncbi:Outer membrane cobalamin receptor protein [Phaeobacter piscinae]|uniref:Outer membrane cobalamin receptor protein n=1 Tax=Phaeobacter piscinae TaxID=1580596 RepID=A0AAN1GSB4_9RHOB|nr:TonB-dependent receptor [Phaeobacter piscinae]ATG44224.1 Outer membrane cobalamin receptor protein [Phaeobacter piscinae]AUR36534.1 Outer membrane cobalamin receptor protein [Phaeobacter piscinae]